MLLNLICFLTSQFSSHLPCSCLHHVTQWSHNFFLAGSQFRVSLLFTDVLCQVPGARCTRCRSLLLRRGSVRDWMVSSPLGVAPMITRPSPLAAPPPNEHSLFRRRVYRNFKSHRDCHSYSHIWAYRLYRLYQLYHAHMCQYTV